MAQRSYFFDSVAGDRIYTSADFARVFGAIAGRDGVIYGYGDELAVSPGSGMNVTVGTGAAFVQGRMLEVYDQAETLPIATADATNPRIDRVVIRVDLSTAQRKAYLAVKPGTPAANPAAPLLQQDSTIWETSLAQVRVPAGATGVVAGNITDEREFTSLAVDELLAHRAKSASDDVHGLAFRGSEFRLSNNVSLATNELTNIYWDVVVNDDIGVYNASASNKLTIPAGVSKVRFVTYAGYAVSEAGVRALRVHKNSTSSNTIVLSTQRGVPTLATYMRLSSPVLSVVEGDYFAISVQQFSGGALDLLSGTTRVYVEVVE